MRKRIWIPVLDFGRGGGHRVLAELATHWARSGCEVALLVNARSPAPYFPTEARIVWLDDQGLQLPGPARLRPGRGPIRLWRVLRSLQRALELHVAEGDAVLANHSLTAWPVWLARRPCRKAYYVQAYEPEYFGLGRPAKWPLWLLSSGSYLLPLRRIVNAPLYLRYKLLRADVFVPPGLDFKNFYVDPATSGTLAQPLIIGCIGRREPEKGTREVLEAQAELCERGVEVELRIAFGNLPPGTVLPPRTHIVDPQGDAELGEFYRSLDFIIAPGRLQFGAPHYPVMEGMACGVGVITTGYLPATAESAWIVDPRSPTAIADAVVNAVARPDEYRRRVANGIAAVQGFGWPAVSQRLLDAL